MSSAGSPGSPGRGRLETHLRARRDAARKLLVPYLTGGVTADWIDLLHATAQAGADCIEIGIPFSDPVMDGPTIQDASLQALQRGTTPASILSDLRAGAADLDVPLVVMTYANVPFRMGARRFAAELVEAGVSGVILPDVPMEELDEWAPAGDAAGVETVLLASPISPDDRLAAICARTRGFVYGVNLLGVTGERAAVGERAALLAKRLKAITDVPVCMGFGVSTGAQAAEIAADADGVVVGSAIMREVLGGAGPEQIGRFVADLRAGLDA